MKRVAAVILHVQLGESPGERLVEAGREAFTQDLVTTLRQAGVARIVVVTSDEEFAKQLESTGASIASSMSEEPFHFGKTIQRIIASEGLDSLLYFGSGTGGLLTVPQVRQLTQFSSREERGALFNNFYSCDFAAIAGAKDLLKAELPPIDNPLGLVLSDLGFPCSELPRDAATQFDIDTPTELLLLAAADRGGEATRAFIEEQRLTSAAIPQLLERLVDRQAHIYLIGRLNPTTWSHFEGVVACRTSALVEGRGMRAYPDRQESMLRGFLEEVGTRRFFTWLGQRADGAIIDSRPLLSKGGRLPPASDRFASDLLRLDQIQDLLWAQFTVEAAAAEIPILLGGHCLVSGGLYLLAEICWKDRDLPRRLHPDPLDWRQERQ